MPNYQTGVTRFSSKTPLHYQSIAVWQHCQREDALGKGELPGEATDYSDRN